MKAVIFSSLIFFSVAARGQQSNYDVTPGNGNGVRFWQSDYYKIHMGNTSEYLYGPVTDYSIKMNMNVDPGRGWTWGILGSSPVAALNNVGNMQIAGSFFANKIGIGTTSPAGGLDINSGSAYAIRTRTSSRYVIEVRNTGDPEGGWWLVNDPNGSFALHENGVSDRFNILAGGNVGIGTDAPIAKLEVIGPATGHGPAVRASGGGDVLLNSGGALFFDGNYSYATGNYIRPLASNTQSFATSGVERLRITPDGNIGVGATSPLNKLQIGPNLPGWNNNDLVISNNNGALAIFNDVTHTYLYGTGNIAIRPGYGQMAIFANTEGNVGIGTTAPNEKLTVNGTIYGKEIKVDLSVPAPDYVFEDNYSLPSLADIEKYIKENKHLPEVPSAVEMKDEGIELGVMNMLLLKKIEELTLYVIELKKENKKQDELIEELQNK